MRRRAAAAVIDGVLKKQGLDHLRGRLTRRFVEDRQLDRSEYWVFRDDNTKDVGQIARRFRDGFPDIEDKDLDKIENRVRRRNARHFRSNGRLKSGWHRLVIPEDNVDLFEAYSEIVLSPLRLEVHWIDTWFYHVLSGEIHCGTNVLRRPSRKRPRWWDVAPSRVLTFEGEEVGAEPRRR